MSNPTTQVSLSSVLKRTGKTVETLLSIADIVDDGISIATSYTSRIKQEQIKEQELKAVEFNNQLKLREVQSSLEYEASSYQLGSKARQLKALPEYEENMRAFEELLK